MQRLITTIRRRIIMRMANMRRRRSTRRRRTVTANLRISNPPALMGFPTSEPLRINARIDWRLFGALAPPLDLMEGTRERPVDLRPAPHDGRPSSERNRKTPSRPSFPNLVKIAPFTVVTRTGWLVGHKRRSLTYGAAQTAPTQEHLL